MNCFTVDGLPGFISPPRSPVRFSLILSMPISSPLPEFCRRRLPSKQTRPIRPRRPQRRRFSTSLSRSRPEELSLQLVLNGHSPPLSQYPPPSGVVGLLGFFFPSFFFPSFGSAILVEKIPLSGPFNFRSLIAIYPGTRNTRAHSDFQCHNPDNSDQPSLFTLDFPSFVRSFLLPFCVNIQIAAFPFDIPTQALPPPWATHPPNQLPFNRGQSSLLFFYNHTIDADTHPAE